MSVASRSARCRALFVIVAGALGVACGTRTTLTVDARAVGGSAGSLDALPDSQVCGARAPLKHRSSGAVCPQGRGPGISGLEPPCTPDAGVVTRCWQDSDCTAGKNGRCLGGGGPFACMSNCSYDTCSNDSDCPANQPCDCRASEDDSSANTCVSGSNCRVDSDCGPCGYCSPTQVNVLCFCPSEALCDGKAHCYAGQAEVPCACGDACGHGYFCHTPSDTCIDDSDCGGQGTCNYDTVNKQWSCSTCWPVP